MCAQLKFVGQLLNVGWVSSALAVQDFAMRADGSNDWSIQHDGSRHPEAKAVKGAVLDFAMLIRRQVVVTYEERRYRTWMVRK